MHDWPRPGEQSFTGTPLYSHPSGGAYHAPPKAEGIETLASLAGRLRPRILAVLVEPNVSNMAMVELLRNGADELIRKPVMPRVLAARIQALLRLPRKPSSGSRRGLLFTSDGSLVLDINSHRCYVSGSTGGQSLRAGHRFAAFAGGGEPLRGRFSDWRKYREIFLVRKEFALLAYLLARKKNLVTHQELWKSLWPNMGSLKESVHTVIQHITRIRRKLGVFGCLIENVWGEGYRLKE